MVDVSTSIEINRPISEVAGFAADPDNATKWYTNIKSVQWITVKPLALGTQLGFKAQFLNREMSYVYKVMEFDLPHRFSMRTLDGPFPMETIYTWEEVSENVTKMTLRNRGRPRGFSFLVVPVMSMAMKKANLKDLKLLKEVLESTYVQ